MTVLRGAFVTVLRGALDGGVDVVVVLKLMESSLYIYIYIKELVRFLRGWLVDIVGLL